MSLMNTINSICDSDNKRTVLGEKCDSVHVDTIQNNSSIFFYFNLATSTGGKNQSTIE